MEDHKTEVIVVPGMRIPELIKFYLTGAVTEASVVIEELRSSELLTEDSRGKWALTQFESAAKDLCLLPFVVSSEKGGVEIPVIPSQESYLTAFLKAKSELVAELEATFGVRKRFRDKLLISVEESELILDEWQNLEVEKASSDDGDEVEAYEARIKEKDDSIVVQKRLCEKEYARWRTAQTEPMADQQKVEEWESAARLKAIKQNSSDPDALLRLGKAFVLLKRFLQGLMVSVSSISGVVRKMGMDGVDPYATGDMRRVYANMLEHYRKSDELGVATCLMAGMRLQQSGGQSLRAFVRKVEEFHETLQLLGVKVVTIADLAAMVAIGGMLEKNRAAFLQSESALALAMDSLEEEGASSGSVCSEGSSVGGTSRRASRRALLSKVLMFVDSEEGRELLSNSLGNKAGREQSEAAREQSAADRKVTVANRNVMSVFEGKKQCWKWALDGKCPFNDACKYKDSHTVEALPKKKKEAINRQEETPVVNAVNSEKSLTPLQQQYGVAARALFGGQGKYPKGWMEDSEDEEDEDE